MDLLEDLEKRGLLENFSDEEHIREMLQTKQTVYCGFDPSAQSLQLGNFIMIKVLQRFQKAGHKVIAVLGGATGMIGDPSGKKAERQFLSEEGVKHNAQCIGRQLAKYIDTSDPDKGLIVNNYDWWSTTDVITYLRDYGKKIQINYMLAKEIVKSRLEAGISYTEFSYMLLQAGDFWRLYRDYGCSIQFGGGDQWGNLTTSLDFVKKNEGQDANAEVFSFKLITDSNGRKFGKSESGALYLDPEMTSPYHIYQYFMNVSDADVLKYLYIFDDRDIEEINNIYKNHMEHPERREGQKELAKVIVTAIHGEDIAKRCQLISEALFKDEFAGLEKEDLKDLAADLNTVKGEEGVLLIDALIQCGLASSRREAREFVSGNAVKINGEKSNDVNLTLTKENALYGEYIFLKRGKRLYAVLTF